MIIGIPRERKHGEQRVALTPDGVLDLCADGHQVLIETHAGRGSGFTNEEYQAAGGTLAPTLEEVWSRAELIVKVKEPAAEEVPLFRRGMTIFSFLHPAAFPEQTEALLASEMSGLSYDLLMVDSGELPILEPMSVIAGKLAIQCGAVALQSAQGGRGVLLGGAPGVPPAKVVVIGAGAAGSSAARVAIGMGAQVSVLDIQMQKLLPFTQLPYLARTVAASSAAIAREIATADLVVGAVLIPGALAPKLITRAMLAPMRQGAVIVDICIDQGGFAESSKPTTLSDPTYIDAGVVHYCVPNMPALVPRTSTMALTNATLRWIKLIARRGVESATLEYAPIRRALVSYRGKMTNRVVAQALNIHSVTEEELLGLLRVSLA